MARNEKKQGRKKRKKRGGEREIHIIPTAKWEDLAP